ncbi:hypothetical protein [Endozoicomonas elysicola]|uniref:Uncharacterized protein n=1 Tax=Endozoicomonas elysicola TaxID=305900 RepID=A0A081KD93_9GAMM|nr:hypothetical protein [Endozoicomonas elysicola]KEI72119.1 hypothetical protein GV64_16520 [Endozoicomonas elysicola]
MDVKFSAPGLMTHNYKVTTPYHKNGEESFGMAVEKKDIVRHTPTSLEKPTSIDQRLPTNICSSMEKAFASLLCKHLLFYGFDPVRITDHQFDLEVKKLIKDIQNKGIRIDEDTPVSKIEKNKSLLKTLEENYDKLITMSRKLNCYLKSGECQRWDTDQNLYRGGLLKYEAEIPRNMQNMELPFRPEMINHGIEIYGKGLYLTTDLEEAHKYFKDAMLCIKLRPSTPFIDLNDSNTVNTLTKSLRTNEAGLVDALTNKLNVQAIIKWNTGPNGPDYFTLKSPGFIERAVLCDDKMAQNEVSFHQFEELPAFLQSSSENLKSVTVTDESKLRLTGHTFDYPSHGIINKVPILRLEVSPEEFIYVFKKPESSDSYYQVRAVAHTKMTQYRLEPSEKVLLDSCHKKMAEHEHIKSKESESQLVRSLREKYYHETMNSRVALSSLDRIELDLSHVRSIMTHGILSSTHSAISTEENLSILKALKSRVELIQKVINMKVTNQTTLRKITLRTENLLNEIQSLIEYIEHQAVNKDAQILERLREELKDCSRSVTSKACVLKETKQTENKFHSCTDKTILTKYLVRRMTDRYRRRMLEKFPV